MSMIKKEIIENKEYLECGLPDFLWESINLMQESWAKIDAGEEDLRWDVWWCNLNSDVNCLEVAGAISSEQAWYLREKYLRMERE